MQLEFGGGENPRQKTYTQVDVRKLNDNTIVCNAWDIEKHVEKNTVTDIYSRHFFEHLTHDQAKRTLDAWYNICKDDARIVLLCPNMNLHLWQWNNWDKLTEEQKIIVVLVFGVGKEKVMRALGIYINQVMTFLN